MVFWRETGTKEDEEEVEVLDILDAEGIIVATDIVLKIAEGSRECVGFALYQMYGVVNRSALDSSCRLRRDFNEHSIQPLMTEGDGMLVFLSQTSNALPSGSSRCSAALLKL